MNTQNLERSVLPRREAPSPSWGPGSAEDSGHLCGHPVLLQGSVCLCCAGTCRGCVFLSWLARNVHDLCFFLTRGFVIKEH